MVIPLVPSYRKATWLYSCSRQGPKSDIQLRESCTPDSEASTRCQTAEKGSTRCSTAEKVNKLEVNLPVLPPVPPAVLYASYTIVYCLTRHVSRPKRDVQAQVLDLITLSL